MAKSKKHTLKESRTKHSRKKAKPRRRKSHKTKQKQKNINKFNLQGGDLDYAKIQDYIKQINSQSVGTYIHQKQPVLFSTKLNECGFFSVMNLLQIKLDRDFMTHVAHYVTKENIENSQYLHLYRTISKLFFSEDTPTKPEKFRKDINETFDRILEKEKAQSQGLLFKDYNIDTIKKSLDILGFKCIDFFDMHTYLDCKNKVETEVGTEVGDDVQCTNIISQVENSFGIIINIDGRHWISIRKIKDAKYILADSSEKESEELSTEQFLIKINMFSTSGKLYYYYLVEKKPEEPEEPKTYDESDFTIQKTDNLLSIVQNTSADSLYEVLPVSSIDFEYINIPHNRGVYIKNSKNYPSKIGMKLVEIAGGKDISNSQEITEQLKGKTKCKFKFAKIHKIKSQSYIYANKAKTKTLLQEISTLVTKVNMDQDKILGQIIVSDLEPQIKYEANKYIKDKLINDIKSNNIEEVSTYFTDNTEKIDNIIESGNAALHIAITAQHKEMVNLLLEKGADVNLMCKGKTPIQINSEVPVPMSFGKNEKKQKKNEITQILEKAKAAAASVAVATEAAATEATAYASEA